MADTQNAILKPSSPDGTDPDPADFLALHKTPDERKKVRSVGFYEMDVLNAPKETEEAGATDHVESEAAEEDGKDGGEKGEVEMVQGGHPEEDREESAGYLDQARASSPTRCRKQSNPTCLCKECVESYLNLCENTTQPGLVGDGEQDGVTPSADSTPCESERSRSGSETSRRTNSSEDDFGGARYEDAQVTLPYPENKQPPECIARLSDAGLYDPEEEASGKAGEEGDDDVSQVVINTAFFVEHPPAEERNVRADPCEKMDVEKGDPENEPLLRIARRSAEREPVHHGCCHMTCLKMVGSFVLSMVIFPALLYGAYAWLPFDAPVVPDVPTRLVYTLRCSAFASFPIVLGVIVHGISRLCASSYDPFKPREREVTIHRRFVKQGTFLFVLFFFNLSVLATYLPQDQLKFIPLLTCLFSLSQLIYWLSFAVGRSFRGFGYGLTFMPLLSMLICNLYFMFVVEPEKMVFLGNGAVPQH